MKYKILIPISILVVILQIGIGSFISFRGVGINLNLSLISLMVFLAQEPVKAIVIGGFIGIIMDLSVGRSFGIYTLTLICCCLITVLFREFFNNESKISVSILGFVNTVVYHGTMSFSLLLTGVNINFIHLGRHILIATFLNIITMFFIYQIIKNKFNRREKISSYERYSIR